MDIKVLKACILSNTIPKLQIFITEEPALSKHYIDYISSTLNYPVHYYYNLQDLESDLSGFSVNNFVYILYNSKEALKYYDKLKQFDKYIILLFDFNDINTTAIKQDYVLFNKLDKLVIVGRLSQILSNNHITGISDDDLLLFVERCNCDLSICLNELDKIIILSNESAKKLFNYMLYEGFSDFKHIKQDDLVDKLCDFDYSVLSSLYKFDGSIVSLLYSLYFKAKSLYLYNRKESYLNMMKLCFRFIKIVLDGKLVGDSIVSYFILEFLNCEVK